MAAKKRKGGAAGGGRMSGAMRGRTRRATKVQRLKEINGIKVIRTKSEFAQVMIGTNFAVDPDYAHKTASDYYYPVYDLSVLPVDLTKPVYFVLDDTYDSIINDSYDADVEWPTRSIQVSTEPYETKGEDEPLSDTEYNKGVDRRRKLKAGRRLTHILVVHHTNPVEIYQDHMLVGPKVSARDKKKVANIKLGQHVYLATPTIARTEAVIIGWVAPLRNNELDTPCWTALVPTRRDKRGYVTEYSVVRIAPIHLVSVQELLDIQY